MQHEAVGGHTGGAGDVELPRRRHIDVAALLGGQAGHGRAEERLGGEVHARPERGHRFTAPRPEVRLVVHEERGAELAGEIERVASADEELSLGTHLGGVGQQRELDRGHQRLTSAPGR